MSEPRDPGTYRLGRGTGPLRGVKVVEIAGIGPGPHAAMILADLGADVIRIERPGGTFSPFPRHADLLTRGRPSVALDLKRPEAADTVLRLVEQADILIEGMRPGVAERLGIGPDECHQRNPRLVFGRMTGWGQDGPWAHAAGHDMNYLAVAGVLHGLGQDPDRPHFPSNLVGDFGGGSTYLVIGVLAALYEAQQSGRGQVVDAAIVDGAAHLNTMWLSLLGGGAATEERAVNMFDGGAPFYSIYETADGKHLAVGPVEPQFFQRLVELLGVADHTPDQLDRGRWADLRTLLAGAFRSRTQAQWCEIFGGTDACVAPVLPVTEAAEHEHIKHRRTYVDQDGQLAPAPAPRFSRTQATLTTGPSRPGADTRAGLAAWGLDDVDNLIKAGTVMQA